MRGGRGLETLREASEVGAERACLIASDPRPHPPERGGTWRRAGTPCRIPREHGRAERGREEACPGATWACPSHSRRH